MDFDIYPCDISQRRILSVMKNKGPHKFQSNIVDEDLFDRMFKDKQPTKFNEIKNKPSD